MSYNRFVLAPDSFKGSMDARKICEIMAAAIGRHFPCAEIISVPVADGGEGTVDCFLEACGGRRISVRAAGPFFDETDAFYGILPDNETAVIELAACAGLPKVGENKRPDIATTYGVGQLICHAVDHGCHKIILGLGGSATNDGGCGMAAAVGVRFYDETGKQFIPTGATLCRIAAIDASGAQTRLSGVDVTVMCDVDNPLYGPSGAAAVFGPQKGAGAGMVQLLDDGLHHLAIRMEPILGRDIANLPGGGAAGGAGAGAAVFLSAHLKRGIETVLDTVGIDSLLGPDCCVLTGEGKVDAQTLRGKVVSGVAARCKQAGVPLLVFCGIAEEDISLLYENGVLAVFPVNRVKRPLEELLSTCETDLSQTVDAAVRLLKI